MFRRVSGLLLALLCLPVVSAAQTQVSPTYTLCDTALDNCRLPITAAIDAEPAGGSIDVAFWFMEDTRYSTRLINAKNRGVNVRVIFDSEALVGDDEASPDFAIRRGIIDSLKNAGIPLRDKTAGGITHWKTMIFGRQDVVNFSAANFSPVGYVPITPNVNYEDEVVVFTTDQSLVATFKAKFDEVWGTTSGYSDYANVTSLAPIHPPVETYDPRMNFSPYQNYATRAVQRYDAEKAGVVCPAVPPDTCAAPGIDVTMYRITDKRHTDAMIRAKQRGLTVRLYTEPEQYRSRIRPWHSYNVDLMYMAGVQIRHRQHAGLNHQKTVILHGQRMVIHGSSNWTSPSANQQLEHNIFETDKPFYDYFVAQFERKWNDPAQTTAFAPLPPDPWAADGEVDANKARYKAPANGATVTNPGAGATLRWNAGLFGHKWDIYFGTSPNPPLVASLTRPDNDTVAIEGDRTWNTGPLQPGTTYYWRIVNKTMADQARNGWISSFTTEGAAPPAVLPDGWLTADVGGVGAPGSANYDSGTATFRLLGSGTDIWGTADEFRYAYTTMTGDGEITARVSGVSKEDPWVKAGVMMRAVATDPASQHATMFVSNTKGLAFQRRAAAGGATVSTGRSGTAPYWVRMTRVGNTFTSYYSTDGNSWAALGNHVINMPATISVGLALTSHIDATLATGTFDHVSVTGVEAPPSTGLPTGWLTTDIGSTNPPGNATYDSNTQTFSLSGSGADIWGTADAFRFTYTDMNGDGEITARVLAVSGEHAWSKVGVMMRASTSANSAHATMFVSSTKGLAFQRRSLNGGQSTSTGVGGAAPYWVKVSRVGNLFTASVSTTGTDSWTVVGTETIAMPAAIKVGLALTSHFEGLLSTATVDNVTIGASTPPVEEPPPSLPDGWTGQDVGATSPAGSATYNATTQVYTLKGAGADIWGTADAFHFASRSLLGDGTITARVTSVQNVDNWTKVGVMMRAGTGAGDAHATMMVTPSTVKGTSFQRRPTAGGASISTAGPVVAPPYWVRLVREASTVTAFTSPDGQAWTPVASQMLPSGELRVGLIVSSHRNGTLATATFDNVTVVEPAAP